jgi:hypothetical protein
MIGSLGFRSIDATAQRAGAFNGKNRFIRLVLVVLPTIHFANLLGLKKQIKY